MTSLAFVDVSVKYGSSVAVQGFTDTVRPGEWLCLIGPNGAGVMFSGAAANHQPRFRLRA